MNKKGEILLTLATLGFLFGTILLLNFNNEINGFQTYVGKVQKQTINEYEKLLSERFALKDTIKTISHQIILNQAYKGINYNKNCNGWQASDCLNKKEEFLEELKKQTKEIAYNLEFQLDKNKLIVTSKDKIKTEKENIKIYLPIELEINLDSDFSDYNKIAYDIATNSHCVLETKQNPNDCFKGLKFQYIVTKEDKLIKYEVTTGKVVLDDIYDIKINFNVDKEKLEEATKEYKRRKIWG